MTTQVLEVENTSFLIEKLASECAPLQEIRELTENAKQAIQKRRESGWSEAGVIIWDVDWMLLNKNPESRIYKLQISDNGCGMTGVEMEKLINRLSSSGREQSLTGNFGVGAKITAGVKNPDGLYYRSWVDSQGSIVILHKDLVQNVYGLKQQHLGDGEYAHYAPIDIKFAPKPIETHGTAVTLAGKSHLDNTMKPEGQPLKWLIKYLNTRYYRLPAYLTIKVRDFSRSNPLDWPSSPEVGMDVGGSQLRTVFGMARHLTSYKNKGGGGLTYGRVELNTAYVDWYILPEEGISQDDIWETKAHIAAVFQDEIYELKKTRSAYSRMREFGIIFGFDRMAIYVEPKEKLKVYSNTARSQLLVGGIGLPWDEWAAEFRQKMPKEIKDMMDDLVSTDDTKDHKEAIRRRLRDIKELFKISRYRRQTGGSILVEGSLPGGSEREDGSERTSKTYPSSKVNVGGGSGNLYSAFISAGGEEATQISSKMNEPEVKWVSVNNKTRAVDDELEDRAAIFNERDNKIMANKDFRVLDDMIVEVAKRYPGAPATEVRDCVEEWFEQQLMEAVLGVLTLKGSQTWDSKMIEMALSPEALTTAVMPRYNMLKQITRSLGQKFGSSSLVTE